MKTLDQTFSTAAVITGYIQSLVTKCTGHRQLGTNQLYNCIRTLPRRGCCRFFSNSRSSCYSISFFFYS